MLFKSSFWRNCIMAGEKGSWLDKHHETSDSNTVHLSTVADLAYLLWILTGLLNFFLLCLSYLPKVWHSFSCLRSSSSKHTLLDYRHTECGLCQKMGSQLASFTYVRVSYSFTELSAMTFSGQHFSGIKQSDIISLKIVHSPFADNLPLCQNSQIRFKFNRELTIKFQFNLNKVLHRMQNCATSQMLNVSLTEPCL